MSRQRSYSRITRQALAMLGKLIRVGRTERGLTAQELADRAGISRTTLYSIEKGAPFPYKTTNSCWIARRFGDGEFIFVGHNAGAMWQLHGTLYY